ncbi:MAG: ribokinase [Lachnospiraceae bacterium]|nr:ribokinase [Lachnospiraceae bacterium]
MRVLNFGSLNIDYVYPVDHIILPGETEPAGEVTENCGGKGLNQSIALAKAGVEVCHAGLVGEEGDVLIDKCREHGVKTDLIRKIPGRSGHTIIQVDRDGQNSILLFGGANRKITKEYVDHVLSSFEKDDLLILQNEINLMDYIVDEAYGKGMKVIMNPSPFDDSLKQVDMSKVTLFFLNEIEGSQMTGEKEPDLILKTLHRLYPGAKVVLTLGGDGAVYSDGEVRYRQGIFKVKAVDTTAAGDTFTGYFVASMVEGMSIPKGLELAARASSITVTRPGATDSIPFRREVEGTV